MHKKSETDVNWTGINKISGGLVPIYRVNCYWWFLRGECPIYCFRSLWQVRLSFVRFCHFREPRFTMIIRTHRRALYHHPVNHTNTVTQSILSSPPLLQTHPHHYFVSGSISSCFLRLVAFVNRTPAREVTWRLTTHALHGHRGDSGSRLPQRYVFKGIIFWGGLRTMRNWRFVHSLLPSEHVFVYLFSTNVSSQLRFHCVENYLYIFYCNVGFYLFSILATE